jgi:hypothetical protein
MTVTALEARYPLLAAAADASSGTLPAAQAGVSVSSKGALVTAFGGNTDGRGTVLRLWELAGASGACTVRVPETLASQRVRCVDLRGQAARDTAAPLLTDEGQTITLKPFTPVSLLFEPHEKSAP